MYILTFHFYIKYKLYESSWDSFSVLTNCGKLLGVDLQLQQVHEVCQEN